jgi:NTP pyrophosphatase (non-canonical NTP hydrolase)
MLNKELKKYQKRVKEFAVQRDWEQFHNPKNLSSALSVEASELMEIYQWEKGEDTRAFKSDIQRKKVEDELIDIFIYWLRISDELGIDIEKSFESKFVENQKKYPADMVRGSSKKYTEY